MDRRHHLIRVAICCGLLLVGFSPAWPQSLPTSGPDSSAHKFRTLLFAAGTQQSAQARDFKSIAPELPELFYLDGDGYAPVEYSMGGVSPSYPYPGGSPLRFYVRTPGDEEEEWIYRAVFEVTVQSDWTEILVVLLPDYNGEGKLKAFAVNTTPTNFEPGTIHVYNLSPRSVVLNADNEIYPLQSLQPIEIDISGIERNLLPVALALEEDSEFELVYRKRWSMRPTIRGIYFLFTLNGDYRRWYMKNVIL